MKLYSYNFIIAFKTTSNSHLGLESDIFVRKVLYSPTLWFYFYPSPSLCGSDRWPQPAMNYGTITSLPPSPPSFYSKSGHNGELWSKYSAWSTHKQSQSLARLHPSPLSHPSTPNLQSPGAQLTIQAQSGARTGGLRWEDGPPQHGGQVNWRSLPFTGTLNGSHHQLRSRAEIDVYEVLSTKRQWAFVVWIQG